MHATVNFASIHHAQTCWIMFGPALTRPALEEKIAGILTVKQLIALGSIRDIWLFNFLLLKSEFSQDE